MKVMFNNPKLFNKHPIAKVQFDFLFLICIFKSDASLSDPVHFF
jgi:hypothetical protein